MPEKTAGAFDVRTFIAVALGLIGLFLVIVGLVADPEYDKTGGVNANLWTGIGMIVVAVVFVLWARLRPVVVESHKTLAELEAERRGEH